MIKNFYRSLVIIFCFISSTFAQHKSVDSLEVVLKNATNDIEKAKLLNQLAQASITKNPELSADYANQALILSQKINYVAEEGNAYINLGNFYILSGNYLHALESFRLAKDLFESNPKNTNQTYLARAYGSIGIVFSEQNSYDNALYYHLKALKIYEKEQDLIKLSRVYNNVGVVYKSQNQHFKALEYFIKAQSIQDSLQDATIGITTTNIGNIYLKQKNFEKALEYFTQAQNQFKKYTNYRGEGELYNNLGLYHQQTNNIDLAITSWHKAETSFNTIEDKFGVSDTYYYLARLYLEKNNFEKAQFYTEKTNKLAKELGALEMLMLSEKQLQDIYETSGNYSKALTHSKNYDLYKDSLVSYQSIRKAVQTEMDYEFEKKEALHKEQQQKQAAIFAEKSKRHQMQLLFGALIVALFLGLGFLFYNRNQLKKTLTLQKNLAEYEQKALHLQMNPHFVFNCLGSISSFIVQNGNDSAIKYLAKFSKLMRLTLEYSKESQIPVDREIEGLQNYLELEQLRFNKAFDFTITKDKSVEDDMALPPLLIQPFVENAIIHGLIPKKERGFLSINFSAVDNTLICVITDNGIGIETSKNLKKDSVTVHKSMALDIIKKRLKILENSTSKVANLDIKELKDQYNHVIGTKVTLTLPI